MSAKKTASSKKKKSASKKHQPLTRWQKARTAATQLFRTAVAYRRNFMARRPHRSFRRTRRRDHTRSLKLPGYWAFTNYVRKTLWVHKGIFIWLMIVYGGLTVLLVGMASQDLYTQLSELIRNTSGEIFKGNWGEIGKAGIVLAAGVTGRLGANISDVQQMYVVTIGLFAWLTVVWLLRAVLAGRKPRVRDGLYNAGAPVLPTFLVVLAAVLQLVPVVVVAIGFAALLPYGILDGGVEAMLFWTAAALLMGLSLYWLTSTMIALVVVTLPGMYPLQAIRTAGDLVIGRRIRILLRLLWMVFVLGILWVLVMVPIILLDTWVKSVFPVVTWFPTVPIALLVMSTLTVVWAASYVYLLYRRIVDDDATPA